MSLCFHLLLTDMRLSLEGDVITGGYDFKLTAIDPAHVYVGMFVSRNADVIFSNIKYTKNE